MKKTFSILITLALVLSLVIVIQTAIPVLGATPQLFENYTTGDDNELSIYGTIWDAQTFTPSAAHTVTSVKLKLFRIGDGPGTITVEIRTTSGGTPTGTILCSGTIDGGSLTTDTNGDWYEISFGSGYAISDGTKYAIVARASGGSVSHRARWRRDTSNNYPGENLLQSTTSGASWNNYASWDYMFQEWGCLPPTEVWVNDSWKNQTDVDAFDPNLIWQFDAFNKIQDGIDNVAGSTVHVLAGTYYENVVIGKSLTLKAASKPVIDGGLAGPCITIAANGVTIDGFELKNGSHGIFSLDTDNSTIKNCDIHDNLCTSYGCGMGIGFWTGTGTVDFDNNTIVNNTIYNNDRQGIYIGWLSWPPPTVYSDGNTISGNTIYNNGLYTLTNGPDESQYGIQLCFADNNTIQDNEIYGHNTWWFGQGIYLFDSYDNTVTGNNIHDNSYGINSWEGGYGRTIGNNYINYNTIAGNGFGMWNIDGAAVTVDATYNWWGDDSGPTHASNPGGTGDAVSDNVDFDPWTGKTESVSTTTGTGNASFTSSAGAIGGVTAVATPPSPPAVLPHGMFSFNVTGLIPGQEVTVTVKLPGPVPVGSVWWKYQGGSWYWLPIGSDDGDDTITVTLTDGGQGDADLTANGEIIDDGGPGPLCRGLIVRSTEGGKVTKPGQGNYVYEHGTIVKLLATPDDGYRFVEWTHDVRRIDDVNAAETTITMDRSYVIIANFVTEETSTVETEVQYELNVSSTIGGAVTSPGEGTFPYIKGAVVSLVASPDGGYEFINWTGDGITNVKSTTVTVTMNGDHSIQANFEFEQTTTTDPTEGSSGPLACFIATAAYGTSTAEQIDVLREFRDVVLLENSVGSQFVALYYRLSPAVADFIAGNNFLRTLVRELLVDPVVWVVEATGAIWRN